MPVCVSEYEQMQTLDSLGTEWSLSVVIHIHLTLSVAGYHITPVSAWEVICLLHMGRLKACENRYVNINANITVNVSASVCMMMMIKMMMMAMITVILITLAMAVENSNDYD